MVARGTLRRMSSSGLQKPCTVRGETEEASEQETPLKCVTSLPSISVKSIPSRTSHTPLHLWNFLWLFSHHGPLLPGVIFSCEDYALFHLSSFGNHLIIYSACLFFGASVYSSKINLWKFLLQLPVTISLVCLPFYLGYLFFFFTCKSLKYFSSQGN